MTTVLTNFMQTSKVRWSCMGHSYPHDIAACSKMECSNIGGHKQGQVTRMLKSQVVTMLQQVLSWDRTQADSEAELVLSPHNSHLSGLCAASWEVVTSEDDNGSCRCITLQEQQAEGMILATEMILEVETPAPPAVPEVNGSNTNLEIKNFSFFFFF